MIKSICSLGLIILLSQLLEAQESLAFSCELQMPEGFQMAYQDSGSLGEELHFRAPKIRNTNCSKIIYKWDFGDGTRGYGRQVAHCYAESGEYEVRSSLYCVCCRDCASTHKGKKDYYNHCGSSRAESCFTYSDSITIAPISVSISEGKKDCSIFQSSGFDTRHPSASRTNEQITLSCPIYATHSCNELLYQWDLGDGRYKNGRSITYAYDRAGTYEVSLLLKCYCCNSVESVVRSMTTQIIVKDRPDRY